MQDYRKLAAERLIPQQAERNLLDTNCSSAGNALTAPAVYAVPVRFRPGKRQDQRLEMTAPASSTSGRNKKGRVVFRKVPFEGNTPVLVTAALICYYIAGLAMTAVRRSVNGVRCLGMFAISVLCCVC